MFQIYGFFILLGIIFSYIFTFHSFFSKYINKSINKDIFLDFFIYIYIFAFIGGKLLFLIFDSNFNFEDISSVIFSGFSVVGASVCGSLGALIYYLKTKDQNARISFCLIPLLILIIHSFGRIGCFFTGCCSGNIEFFKNIPLQIFSSFWYLIAFIIGIFLYKKDKFISFYKSIYFYIFFVVFERILFDPFRDDKVLVYKIYNQICIYKYQLFGFFTLIIFSLIYILYIIIKLFFDKNNK